MGRLPANYGTRKPASAKWMTKPEVSALLWGAHKVREQYPYAFNMVLLMYLLGLRVGEVRLLRYESLPARYIDSGGYPRAVEVRTLKKHRSLGTGDKRPTWWVPILAHHDLVRDAFDPRLRDPRAQAKGWLFPSARSTVTALSKRQLMNAFAAARRAAGLPSHYSTHALRHSASTHLARAGADPSMRARFLRHDLTQVVGKGATETYRHVNVADWLPWVRNGALRLPMPFRPLATL